MKFPKFDYQAVKSMLDKMSPEEREQIAGAAANLMKNMDPEEINNLRDQMQQEAEQVQNEVQEEEERESQDVFAYYRIDDDLASRLEGNVLSSLEAASDLEQFYEDEDDADYSATVLFLSKAVLMLLRRTLAPVLNEAGISGFSMPAATTLFQYVQALNEENCQKLQGSSEFSQEGLFELHSDLMQLYLLLQRAEFDTIGETELLAAKNIVFDKKLLERLSA